MRERRVLATIKRLRATCPEKVRAGKFVQATWNFQASTDPEENEITLRKGDVLELDPTKGDKGGWLYGKPVVLENARAGAAHAHARGFFPKTYVKVITPLR